MQIPLSVPVGTPIAEVDTPGLVLDIEQLTTNLAAVRRFASDNGVSVRLNASSHMCPELALVESGSPQTPIAVDSISHAEAFVDSGFVDVLITKHVTTESTVARVVELARRARVVVPVDSVENAEEFAAAASRANVVVPLMIEVRVGLAWCGAPPDSVHRLVRALGRHRSISIYGLATAAGPSAPDGPIMLRNEMIDSLADLRARLIPDAAIRLVVWGVDDLSYSGRFPPGVELCVGRATLSDGRLASARGVEPAALVLSTVTSTPEPDLVISDAGQKAVSSDLGLPIVKSHPHLAATRLAAEHGIFRLAGPPVVTGEKIWLVPACSKTTANLHDHLYVMRAGRLEAIWRITARGRYE